MTEFMVWSVAGVLITGCLLFAWGLVKSAGDADDTMEEIMKERNKGNDDHN